MVELSVEQVLSLIVTGLLNGDDVVTLISVEIGPVFSDSLL